jgi:3-hydroxyacyl-[acyl-carrier-protein] dehydratase
MQEGENILNTMDIYEVLKHLPHRYPFLLVDRVTDYKENEYLSAFKNVSYNEPFFQGHFPHRPVMPGVLILEALAQATGLLAYKSTATTPSEKSLYYFVGIDKARFKQPVEPGDKLTLDVKVVRTKRGVWKFDGVAKVDGKVVCEAELMCAERDV